RRAGAVIVGGRAGPDARAGPLPGVDDLAGDEAPGVVADRTAVGDLAERVIIALRGHPAERVIGEAAAQQRLAQRRHAHPAARRAVAADQVPCLGDRREGAVGVVGVALL